MSQLWRRTTDDGRTTECEDRAILKQNSQFCLCRCFEVESGCHEQVTSQHRVLHRVLKTPCEVLWWYHSRSVTKNLTPYRLITLKPEYIDPLFLELFLCLRLYDRRHRPLFMILGWKIRQENYLRTWFILESMLKINIYIGINAHVTIVTTDNGWNVKIELFWNRIRNIWQSFCGILPTFLCFRATLSLIWQWFEDPRGFLSQCFYKEMFQIHIWKQLINNQNGCGCKMVWHWFIFWWTLFLHRVKVHLLDQLLFLRPNVSNFIIKETAPILGFLLASTIHFIDDHWGHWMWWHWGTMSRGQDNFDDDAWKPKCQYGWSFWRWSHQDITMITIIALTMMIMIWTRGLVRGCQEVARSRSPCPRPAADKHTPPNALSATYNAMQCNSAYNATHTKHTPPNPNLILHCIYYKLQINIHHKMHLV